MFLLILSLILGFTSVNTQDSSCSRCRAFELSIGCEAEENKASVLYNGYKCAAVSGANVKLNCDLGDSEGLTTSYKWYKSSKVGGLSFTAMGSDTKQITNCTTSTCTLYNVQWGAGSSNLEDHDSFFYQCVVGVKDGDSDVATLYSNVLSVDVQAYSAPTGSLVTDSHSVDIGTPEVKLECPLPNTNPPSTAVWTFYESEAAETGTAIENVNNMLIVQNTIVSTDSKFGYELGMLVIMNFKSSDAGVYRCTVKHETLLGVVNQKDVTQHSLSTSGVTQSSVSESLRIVSKVSSPDFLFNDTDMTVLDCLGSNLVAGETAQHYWQQSKTENGIIGYVNISSGSDFQISNNGRTLTFSKNYNLATTTFRCQIQKGATSILINEYYQSPILPKSGKVPTGMSCAADGLYSVNTDSLMSADLSSTTGQTQILAGSSYYWKVGDTDINKFTSGYTVSSSSLSGSVTEDCLYIQQFKYYENLYSIQQTLAVSTVPVSYTTIPTLEMSESENGDILTITCTANTDTIPDMLQNKAGLNVLVEAGGCMEYASAVTETSDNSGTCGTSITRWVKIDKAKLCSDCVIRCSAATSCVTSEEKAVTVPAGSTSCANGNTGAITDSNDFPAWGIALICVVVVIGLIATGAVFFYTFMQRQQQNSDGQIVGATVLKVNAEDDKLYSVPDKKKVENAEAEVVKTINLSDDKISDIP